MGTRRRARSSWHRHASQCVDSWDKRPALLLIELLHRAVLTFPSDSGHLPCVSRQWNQHRLCSVCNAAKHSNAITTLDIHPGSLGRDGGWAARWDPLDGKMVMCSSLSGSSKAPNLLHRHSLDCRAASHYTGTLAPGTWPFPTPNASGQVQSLDTEALPKFGKEKEARSLSGLYRCAVSHNPDVCAGSFRLWMDRAFSSCLDRTCRHSR